MSKYLAKVLVIWMVLWNGFAISQVQENWTLSKKKDGIEVFTQKTKDSAFKSFKARMTITGNVESFIALLLDLEAMPEWGSNIKYTRLLERSGDSLQIYYSEASVPFPFSNRDGIYLNRFRWNESKKLLFVEIEILPGYLPVNADMVRVKGSGFWQVDVLSDGLLQITFQMQVDPGGAIPAWLANMFTDETPYESLSKIRELVKRPEYQNRKFDFIR